MGSAIGGLFYPDSSMRGALCAEKAKFMLCLCPVYAEDMP